MNLKLLYFLLFPAVVFCQEFSPIGSFGNFNLTTSFSINNSGRIFIADDGSDEVYSFDSLGNGLKLIGGYGWDESSFDDPADVFSSSLNVYVADKNNHRIEFFDKDLNYIGQINTRESEDRNMQFGYPLSCAVSNQGDLYILDSENKRIVKFDMFGNFVQNFGGYESGGFVLENPTKIAVYDNNIYVLDENKIYIFDQYGNNFNLVDILPAQINNITISSGLLILNNANDIFISSLSSVSENSILKFQKLNIPDFNKEDIVSALFHKEKLYVLTTQKVYILAQI
ncbi:MAG TPA: NHL repeat-containing protein [Ignavibacteriaceae bacterium]|nr:NHL repeat-containing protein [Ignavibacteriaceae bacterium]